MQALKKGIIGKKKKRIIYLGLLACMLDIIMCSGVNTVLITMINWIMLRTIIKCVQLKYTLIIG